MKKILFFIQQEVFEYIQAIHTCTVHTKNLRVHIYFVNYDARGKSSTSSRLRPTLKGFHFSIH